MNRRDLLRWTIATAALSACGGVMAGDAPPADDGYTPEVDLSPEEWKKHLTAEEYRILRDHGTERAFTGDLWDHKGDGVYACAGCGQPLYDSKTKFKSGTGWPSYYAPVSEGAIREVRDSSLGMVRIETRCGRCDGHLGHVFPDGPQPTGMRHCINSASLDFVPRKKADKLGEVKLGGFG